VISDFFIVSTRHAIMGPFSTQQFQSVCWKDIIVSSPHSGLPFPSSCNTALTSSLTVEVGLM